MTEKLYYIDGYTEKFTATVISSEPSGELYDTVLDRTAFFPEESGQYADSGEIDGIAVSDVKLRDGIIHHYTAERLEAGKTVWGIINFPERYEKMQSHTAEHILSGIIHTLFGLDNVGFHLGKEDVTMDISAPISQSELDEVERLANEVIYKNIEVTATFPTPEELSAIQYRSKLDLKDGVRIVKIGDVDSCACAAPHVARTGEIGIIKILDSSKLRGGLRIHIAAGRRAVRLFSSLFKSALSISDALSLPRDEIAGGVIKLQENLANTKADYAQYRLSKVRERAERISATDGNLVLYFPDVTGEELIAFSNAALERVGGMLVLLADKDSGYRYVISSSSSDLRALAPEINKSLLGRGGGNSGMLQGSFGAPLDAIKEYFKS